MDLSWCIICDRHCVEDNLYCSELCRVQDANHNHSTITKQTKTAVTPPSSPLLDPFFSSFNHHDRRTSITISKSSRVHYDMFGSISSSQSSVPRYSLSD
ncbi:uncharacterized protein B0P05DRAFT_527434 [Gilbertella persicaria]|uniref:uncharacterized protein n=1 Tax=Gilbertella persicaria TaxID=101096 RepID=UPI002220252C|nr:uncharacterized protein B0P05DRAFT_527434 [Gilbertella persicaria]KAI8091416.1 hypothetical protein B0P05DRAFT_527434 [Gilbertella persicaria]